MAEIRQVTEDEAPECIKQLTRDLFEVLFLYKDEPAYLLLSAIANLTALITGELRSREVAEGFLANLEEIVQMEIDRVWPRLN